MSPPTFLQLLLPHSLPAFFNLRAPTVAACGQKNLNEQPILLPTEVEGKYELTQNCIQQVTSLFQ